MSRRALTNAFRGSGSSWSLAGRPATLFQQRSFSRSQRQSYDILLPKPTSPELETVLNETLTKIIIPSHLPEEQYKQVFRGRFKDRLKADPIVTEIEGFECKLTHIDRTRDIISNNTILEALLEHAKTRDDWQVLPNLLSGLEHAGRPFGYHRIVRSARSAGNAGQIYSIIDCARQVKKTGVSLGSRELTNSILYHVVRKGQESGWEEGETKKALGWAEKVLEMLEDPSHVPRQMPDRVNIPLFKDPLVLGAVLNLAAARAVKHTGGEDVDGKVALYAQKLVGGWRDDRALRSVEMQLSPRAAGDKPNGYHSKSEYLVAASPALRGMELAMQVVDAELSEKLGAIAAKLRAEVDNVLAESGEFPTRGVQAYRDIFEIKE